MRTSAIKKAILASIICFYSGASAHAAASRLVCELTDVLTDTVVDRNSDSLSNPKISLILGGRNLLGTVRDIAQPDSTDRKLELTLVYRNFYGSGQAHAGTTYVAETAPVNETLAETSIDLAPSARRVVLRCFLN